MDKIHKKETLMRYSKERLAEHCMALEHNNKVLRESFDIQYSNCMKIIKDMKIINETYKSSKDSFKIAGEGEER